MKRILLIALATIICLLCAGSVFADELWNPHLRGVDEGCVSCILPPKGLWFVDNNYWGSMTYYDGSGNATPTRLDLYVNVPILLYNPGVKFLKANYACAIAQPIDYTSVYSRTTPTLGNGHWGLYNTVLIPAILDWSLPKDFYVKAAAAVYLDDATTSPAHPANDNGAGSGNSFTTLEPNLAISWMHKDWMINADWKYDKNFEDTSTHYQSGDEFTGDYTVEKMGKTWSYGVGAYQENQIDQDKLNGATVPGSIRLTYGAGPIVSYDFGPLMVTAVYNFNISTHNDFGGDTSNIRFTMPL